MWGCIPNWSQHSILHLWVGTLAYKQLTKDWSSIGLGSNLMLNNLSNYATFDNKQSMTIANIQGCTTFTHSSKLLARFIHELHRGWVLSDSGGGGSLEYAHFIPVKHPFTAQHIAQLFFSQVVKLHGFSTSIVSDWDKVFTSTFWQELFKLSGAKLHLSSAYHPQSDGQTERINQCLEMFLRCAVHNSPSQWAKWIDSAKLWYNTCYHSSLKCSPFKVSIELSLTLGVCMFSVRLVYLMPSLLCSNGKSFGSHKIQFSCSSAKWSFMLTPTYLFDNFR